jgi:glycosyltransferase involved in cell wall biosynthesis
MRIGINVSWMKPGDTGGMEWYIRELIYHLAQIDLQNEYVLVLAPINHKTFRLPGPRWKKIVFTGDDNTPMDFKYITHDLAPDHGWVYKLARKGYYFLHNFGTRTWQGKFADLIKEQRIDIWFCPLIYALPLETDVPIVNTIPDLQHEHFPEFFNEAELAFRSIGFQYSCMAATATIGISQNTANDIVRLYGIDQGKVFAIPLALEHSFEISRQEIDRLVGQVRIKYRVDRDYVYFPANGWPHKNHVKLVEAMHYVREKGCDLDLILTGVEFDLLDRFSDVLKRYDLGKRVRHLGYVDRLDVIGLYGGAKMLAFPSLFEGFGLPLLEAMYIGTPVVCSRIGSLPEVGGDAVVYFDPQDARSIADAILRVAKDEQQRQQLVAAGKETLKKFNYFETARKTLEIFERIQRGELQNSKLSSIRPLTRHNWLSEGHGRWYFHNRALKELRLQLFQHTDLPELANQTVQVHLNNIKVLESKIEPGKNHLFSISPAEKADNGFYRLDIAASSKVDVNGQCLSVRVMKIEIVEESARTVKLV